MPYASLNEAYAPLVPDREGFSTSLEPLPKVKAPMERPAGTQALIPASSTLGLPDSPAVENTIEYEKANEHIKNSVFSPNLPHIPVTYKQMDSCQDFRVHLRNCPACMQYMKDLIASENQGQGPKITETFLNMFQTQNTNDPLIDIVVIIGMGVLIIFILDSFVRLGKSLA